jgi:hypothetical protein
MGLLYLQYGLSFYFLKKKAPFPIGMEISSTFMTLTSCHARRRIFNAQQNRMTRHYLEFELCQSFTFNYKQLELEENQN